MKVTRNKITVPIIRGNITLELTEREIAAVICLFGRCKSVNTVLGEFDSYNFYSPLVDQLADLFDTSTSSVSKWARAKLNVK